jgi:type II secretory pathway pseudopilin PulG
MLIPSGIDTVRASPTTRGATTTMPTPPRSLQMGSAGESGFTALELLVVVLVILALFGMLFPAVSYARNRSAKRSVAALVVGIAAAIQSYPRASVTVPAKGVPGLIDGQMRTYFDFNLGSSGTPTNDFILDGDPDLDPGFTAEDRLAAKHVGYRGFLGTTGTSLPKSFVAADGRIVDVWRNPIHIRFAVRTYGSASFGVWSDGPDRSEGTADDIRSWSDDDQK